MMKDQSTNKGQSPDRKDRKWGSGSELLLPTRPIRKIRKSFVDLGAAFQDLGKRFRSGLPDGDAGKHFEEGDPRGIDDPSERFAAVYAAHAWTREELDEQISAIRRSKLTAMIMTAVAFAGAIASLVMLPVLLLLLVVPFSGCIVILGLVQWLRFALYETQIELRSLISAKQFASREDFFRRLVK